MPARTGTTRASDHRGTPRRSRPGSKIVTAEQVIAFRLERLGLRQRAREVRACAAPVGLPDFPPGAALAALAPRLEGATPGSLDDGFEAREIVRTRAMRGAPVIVRSEDYDLFVSGVLPRDEPAMRAFIGPAMSSVNAAGMSALAAVEVVTDEATRALSKQALDRDALHAELRRRLPAQLLPHCRPCDSHHVHPSLLYAIALRGRFVLFPRSEGPYLVALADRWLPARRRGPARGSSAPAELLRRYLRAYGPSTIADFAAWSGTGGGQPRAAWQELEDELSAVEVRLDRRAPGAARWILAEDRAKLAAASAPDLVRLLSPGDPLLQMRDRNLLAPDATLQKIIWKNLAPAGVLLVGTRVAGLVRTRKKKSALDVVIEPIEKLGAKARAAAETEAERLAAVRGTALALSWG